MRLAKSGPLRRAAVLLESAFSLFVLLFLLLATVVGGYGIFRYQQMAALSREAARYASVHGGQYEAETGNPAATPTDIYNQAILPYTCNLDLARLSYTVTWNSSNTPSQVTTDYEKAQTNTVTVTVSYQWIPEFFLVGPYTLRSTTTLPMSY
jgi:Flp pilus assembly protein TadG